MAGGRENEGGESCSCGGSGVIQSLRRLVRVGELNISDWLLYGFILTLTLTLTQPFEWDLEYDNNNDLDSGEFIHTHINKVYA